VRTWVTWIALLTATRVEASPNVSLDDPRYIELAIRRALGGLPLYRGGSSQMSESRVRALLEDVQLPRGGWLRADRALLSAGLQDQTTRTYSTAARDRALAGHLAMSCDHVEGRPCLGNGALAEVDASAGYGDVVSGTLRLRTNAGSEDYDAAVAIDRAYVVGELGPVSVELGRDTIAIGPRGRTQLAWGDHPTAVDQVRIATNRPIELSRVLAGNFFYAVGRVRAPQTFPGTLVTISRVQLDIANRLELGAVQLLQLGGKGAAEFGPIDFVLEHINRRDSSGTMTDSSNRRFGGDISFDVPALLGSRFYYSLVFEDIRRKRWPDAIRYDADHLVGVDLAAIRTLLGFVGATIEYQQNGLRSQEHGLRTTGFTHGERAVGTPLGPDTMSLYLAGRVPLSLCTLMPWIEYATLSSDTYSFTIDGPIDPATQGLTERRRRLGARAVVEFDHGIDVEAVGTYEHVSNFGFEAGVTRNNVGLVLRAIWRAPSPTDETPRRR
jgi:hypothetical protein